jgi:alkylation response protein AidB-like acyl-CoA dehydrogenase
MIDAVRRAAAERVVPRAAAIDHEGRYPQDMFDLLRGLGLFSLPFSAGDPAPIPEACAAIEILARVCASTAQIPLLQWLPTASIQAGGEPLRARFLAGLLDGSLRAALSLHADGVQARRDGDGYRLDGSTQPCLGAPLADLFVLAAQTAEAETGTPIQGAANLFVVERGTVGLSVEAAEERIGLRGIPAARLSLRDVFVPHEYLIAGEGRGVRAVAAALRPFDAAIASCGVGLAQGALDLALHHASEGENRAELANMALRVEAARSLARRAAEETGSAAALPTMAAVFAAEVAHDVAGAGLRLAGPAALAAGDAANRFFRDATALLATYGPTPARRDAIARAILEGSDV